MVRHKIELSMKSYRKCKNLILEFLNQFRLSCSYTFYIVVITGSAKWVNTLVAISYFKSFEANTQYWWQEHFDFSENDVAMSVKNDAASVTPSTKVYHKHVRSQDIFMLTSKRPLYIEKIVNLALKTSIENCPGALFASVYDKS